MDQKHEKSDDNRTRIEASKDKISVSTDISLKLWQYFFSSSV